MRTVCRRNWWIGWRKGARRMAPAGGTSFGWLIRGWREVAWRVGLALRAPTLERQQAAEVQRILLEQRRLSEEHARGYLRGWKECFDVCMEAIDDEIAAFEESEIEEPEDAAILARAKANRVALRAVQLDDPASRKAAALRAGRPKPN